MADKMNGKADDKSEKMSTDEKIYKKEKKVKTKKPQQ